MKNKMKHKSKKLAKLVGKISGGKAMSRMDKKSRGGKMSGGERPSAEGMSPESPISNASPGIKTKK